MSTVHIGLVTGMLCAISFGTRALPFIMGKRLLAYDWLVPIKKYLPTIIIFIVLVYELMGFTWRRYPFGLPSVLSIVLIIFVQWRWKQELLSILLGVLCFSALNFLLGAAV